MAQLDDPPGYPTGGIPGFRFFNQWAALWTERVTGQVEALNRIWDRLRGNEEYSFRHWVRDLANLWERSFATASDVLTHPLRTLQQDRPTWVSLVWSRGERGVATDTTQDEVPLNTRIPPEQQGSLTVTNLERLGTGGEIPSRQVHTRVDSAGNRLMVQISELKQSNPEVGH
jgi:hypothetical protein